MTRLLRRTSVLLATGLAAGALAACGEDEEEDEAPAAQTQTQAAKEVGCKRVAEPRPKREQDIKRPSLRLKSGTTYTATVATNCGEFTITLDPEDAPKTGGSFVTLAKRGFYDDVIFHRIVPGFVIQGGDPQGTGQGGPGYSVVEAPPRNVKYTRGVVAMAKTEVEDPGTSGSQFFVVTAEDAQLPPDYALLGKVTKGQDVVQKIAAVETDAQDRPTTPVVISKVTIDES